MNIAYITTFLDRETSGTYGRAYSEAGYRKKLAVLDAFTSRGHEVEVISPILLAGWGVFQKGSETRKSRGHRIRYPPTRRTLPGLNLLLLWIATISELRRLARNGSVDAVVFYNWHPVTAVPALIFAKTKRVPLILQYEDGLFAHAGARWVQFGAWLLETLFDRLLDGAILNSSSLKERVSTQNVAIVRGILDPVPETREETNPADGPLRVLHTSSLDGLRGSLLLVDACSELCDTPGVSIQITGGGSSSPDDRLVRAVKALETRCENMTFIGYLDRTDYEALIEDADVVLNLQEPDHPFSRYCFPSKVVDLMARGKVVVSTEISDLPDWGDGRLILVEGATEAAEAVTRLRDSPGLRRRLAAQARRWAIEECGIDEVGARLDRLLQSIRSRDPSGTTMRDPGRAG